MNLEKLNGKLKDVNAEAKMVEDKICIFDNLNSDKKIEINWDQIKQYEILDTGMNLFGANFEESMINMIVEMIKSNRQLEK